MLVPLSAEPYMISMSVLQLALSLGGALLFSLVLFMVSAFIRIPWWDESVSRIRWLYLCAVGAVVSFIAGGVVGLTMLNFGDWFRTMDYVYQLYVIEAVVMVAFNAVVASWSDLMFRKVSRPMLVGFIIVQVVCTTVLCLVTPHATWLLVASLVGGFLCWCSGLVPGGGMSDGRMLCLYCVALLPLYQNSLWIPVVATLLLACIWTFIAYQRAGHTDDVSKAKQYLKTSFPVAPLLGPTLLVFMLWFTATTPLPFALTTGL